jgi:ElaB/YqjD/DUF883 family membrane-anchored ribosome-binding protein
MTTMTKSGTSEPATRESGIWPGLKSLDESVRKARELVDEGRHATEQLVSSTISEVQQHPLRTLFLATAGGALAGCLTGFAFGRRAPVARRKYDWMTLFR